VELFLGCPVDSNHRQNQSGIVGSGDAQKRQHSEQQFSLHCHTARKEEGGKEGGRRVGRSE